MKPSTIIKAGFIVHGYFRKMESDVMSTLDLTSILQRHSRYVTPKMLVERGFIEPFINADGKVVGYFNTINGN